MRYPLGEIAAFAALLSPACLPSDTKEESGVRAYFRAMVAVSCTRNDACCGDGPASECEDLHSGFVADGAGVTGDYLDAVERGRMEFDQESADACKAWLKGTDCEEWSAAAAGGELPAACFSVFRGKVAEGEACGSHAECESGFCDPTQLLGEPVLEEEGICRARGGAGDPCRTDLRFDGAPCARGLVCHLIEALEPGVCEPMLGEGESCQHHEQCWGVCDDATGGCSRACSASLYLPFSIH